MTKQPHDRFKEDIERRQRNTVWPDTMLNGAKVDGFMWKGSPTATKVQRAGSFVFGIIFLFIACAFLALAFRGQFEPGTIVVVVMASGAAYLGCRFIRNALLH